MSECRFCGGQLNNQDKCVWCGFSQDGRKFIPGTISYGTKLGRYVIGEVKTADGESTVYDAFDTQTQQRVCIKEFLPLTLISTRKDDKIIVQPDKQVLYKNLMYDFEDLYKTLQQIESSAMPKVLQVFGKNNTVYAVLEEINAVPLRDDLIKRGRPYTFKEIRWLLQPIFQLLYEMSKFNIHHGGISDETILVTGDNTFILTGFAIQDLRAKNDHITYKLYDGFSAPEQYYPDRFQGSYTDIYALSCLIYYAVTGGYLDKIALDSKDIHRFFPKYVIETFRYGTKENPKDRIDKISDFVMMLDDKGTVVKPKAEKTKEIDKKLIAIYAGLAVILLAVLFFLFKNISDSSETESIDSQTSEEIVSSQLETSFLPDFRGKDYAEVIKDARYQKDYTFVRLESYSDSYPVGQICQQSPLPQAEVKAGETVYLTVSLGPNRFFVPNGIIGINFVDAARKLDEAGIKYVREYVDQSREFVEGMVAQLSVGEGQEIGKDEVLIVYVANNKPISEPMPQPTPTPTLPAATPSPSPSPTVSPTTSPETESSFED